MMTEVTSSAEAFGRRGRPGSDSTLWSVLSISRETTGNNTSRPAKRALLDFLPRACAAIPRAEFCTNHWHRPKQHLQNKKIMHKTVSNSGVLNMSVTGGGRPSGSPTLPLKNSVGSGPLGTAIKCAEDLYPAQVWRHCRLLNVLQLAFDRCCRAPAAF